MIPFVVHDATGRILRSGSCPASDLALQAGEGETALALSGRDDLHWINGGVLEARPRSDLPARHTLAADTDWTVADVPEGTVVLIEGAEVGTVDAEGLVLNFPEAGVWHVRLAPPFPWAPMRCTVTVE